MRFRKGDVLLGKLRPNLRKCVLAPFDGYCSTDIIVLRSYDGVDREFAAAMLSSEAVGAVAERTAAGTKMPRTSWKELRNTEVFCPSEDEQTAIAHRLISLQRAIAATATNVRKLSVAREGLVDDLLTRGLDANGELRSPASVAAHLYQRSPLGTVPTSWKVGPLDRWLIDKPRNGYSPVEAPAFAGTYMLGLGCLRLDGFHPCQLKFAPTGDARVSTALLDDGDLLISRANTRQLVGLAGVYRSVGHPCIYPDLMMKLRVSNETTPEFLELVLQASSARRQIQAAASGTSGSMVKISGATVRALQIPRIPLPEQQRILERMAAVRQLIAAEQDQLRKLKLLKAALADDLLTGRVRVTQLLADEPEPELQGAG
ncbi:restriction endonuclease subunit S [Sphingomonas sp. LY54]|uniref:restriction endonuclease subunit S n=1 Tax=Sphingomonas sp. LY54 TaxID=3095343 RepID=UPI002D79A89B|nr:restriction endonuclease subunit S [Sphingomonas sp. LY54]WRP30024.1 restriction endonuclease subunit S [Sphingomonas sp. LY54]